MPGAVGLALAGAQSGCDAGAEPTPAAVAAASQGD